MMQLIRKLFPKGVGPTVFNNYLIMGIQVLSGIMLARLLGPMGRGQLALCILWPTLIASIGSLGIKDAVVFYTAKNELTDRLVPTFLWLAAIQSLLLAGAGYFLLPIFLHRQEPDVIQNLRLFLLFIPLNLIGQNFIGIYEGKLNIHFANLIRMIMPVISFAVTLLLLVMQYPSIRIILISYLVGNLFIVVLCIIVYIKERRITWKLSLKLLNELFQYGIRSHLGAITNNLNLKLDQMLMSVFLSTEALGFYVVAVSASGLVGSLSNGFMLILFPTVAKSKDLLESRNLISDFLVKTLVLVSVSSIILLGLFPFLFPMLYGEEFSLSIRPAQILLIAVIFSSIRDILAFSHRALNNPMVAAKSEIYALIATGIALAALLPSMGITGAAIASLLSYATAGIYNLWKMQDLYGFSPLDLFKIVKPKQA
jgi:O-antigen/teichoic acid export membrane protein